MCRETILGGGWVQKGNSIKWLVDFCSANSVLADGLMLVGNYTKAGRPAEEVAIMEKAEHYGADAVFFEASRDGKAPVAQAFVYRSNGPAHDPDFGGLHQKLWSWGGVPLIYRVTPGLVQLFRCAHRPDFEYKGQIDCNPFKTLKLASDIASQLQEEPWWDAEQLHTGTLWDDPAVCKQLLSSKQAAQKTLIDAVKKLYQKLIKQDKDSLPKTLVRRLLILSVLIAYLEKREVFEDGFFSRFLPGSRDFFQVLADGQALVNLLDHLEQRFNGHVFVIDDEDRKVLLESNNHLAHFAQLVEGRQEPGGQRTLWQRYSFADLPVELISHIYQLFVEDADVAVYTPHFVVRLMLNEVLSWERLDRLKENNEVILDPACGSGIFLVEAYKRLVLHWRLRNDWAQPDQKVLRELLTSRVRGVDKETGAVELASFSLCLALCDALEPMEIRSSVKLFPPLKETTIHTGCFFETVEKQAIKDRVGVIVGNPPFASRLDTGGAQRSCKRYQKEHGVLPDKQIAYLFLHESMELLAPGGVIAMLQQYNFLYNQKSIGFRRKFIERWDVREILDFISVRGLFIKGGADTKIVIVVAEAQTPLPERQILHATFRRSGRTDAEQGFDIDYYDMHWLPRELVLRDDGVWRADTVGGGRVLAFVNRLKGLNTIGHYADERNWDFGEGWIEGEHGKRIPAFHITDKPYLPSRCLTHNGIDESGIKPCRVALFKSSYTEKRFLPPMLLIRSQSDLHHSVWEKHYLTYTQRIIGFCGPNKDAEKFHAISQWLERFKSPLQAYLAATSPRIFTQKSSALSKDDIVSLPLDMSGEFQLTPHESLISADIIDYYCDLIRLGEKSAVMNTPGVSALPSFNEVFTPRINGIYKNNELHALEAYCWPGVICQPYVFGNGKVDWSGADELKHKIDSLLHEERGCALNVTRIARIYDGACIYMLKPNRLRYWLRSIALRDADETLADLAAQGF